MKIIIAGAGEVGSHLAKMLSNEANEITVIDSDSERLEVLRSHTDVLTVEGNPSAIHVLHNAEVEKADLFIAVNPSESQDVNIVSAMLAKKMGSKKVTARINNEEYLSYENKYLFTEMGIDLLFYPEKIAAGEIVELLKRTASTDSLDFARGRLQVAVFKLEEESPMIGMNMLEFSQLAAEDGLKFRVVAISRGDQTIVPKFDTKFKYHDLVFIVSKREGVEMLMKYLGKRNIEVDKIMILGGSPIAEIVAKQMSKQVDSIKLIDLNKEKCLHLSETLPSNVIVVNGDGRNSDMLLEENIRDYDAFVAVTNNSETNILACLAAKRRGVRKTIAQVENLDYISMAESLDIGTIINKKIIAAGHIYQMLLDNEMMNVKFMMTSNADVAEFTASFESKITRKPVKDLGLPHGMTIGGLMRAGRGMLVSGMTQIQPGDSVMIFSHNVNIRKIEQLFK